MTYTRHSSHSAYRQASATSWTRIDMLLALYDATLFAVEHGVQAIQAANEKSLIEYRFRSQRLITELLSGVDTEQGELPENVHRLLMFCLMQTCGESEEEWSSAASIIAELKGAFRTIRDQAVQLEQSGSIPALNQLAADRTCAVG